MGNRRAIILVVVTNFGYNGEQVNTGRSGALDSLTLLKNSPWRRVHLALNMKCSGIKALYGLFGPLRD